MIEDRAPGMKSARVALVLGFGQNFWLDQRVQRTARALAAAGYEVLAYTPVESRASERPMDGIAVRYVRTPLGNLSILKKLFVSHLLYNIPAALDILRTKARICHCNDFDTLPCGALVKALTLGRTQVVYDSHEDYPLFIEWGHGKLLARVIAFAEVVLTRFFADAVLTVTEGIASRFDRRGLRSTAILNCQELLDPEQAHGRPAGNRQSDDFTIVYQGKIFPRRGYEQLIEAADILINGRGIQNMRFQVIGDSGPFADYQEHLVNTLASKGLTEYFSFLGFIDYDEMMQLLRRADVGVMPFEPTLKNRGALPNKLFENLVAGIPTISSDLPEIARVINEEKCGLLVDPTRPEEIADAIEYLYRHGEAAAEMGRNALRAAQEKYNFAKQAERLLGVYRELTGTIAVSDSSTPPTETSVMFRK